MQFVREYMATPRGRVVGIAVSLLVLVGCAFWVWSYLGPSAAAAASRKAHYVCAKTGKGFEVRVEPGLTNPVLSPHSGEKTGYPAELCYWTADGKVAQQPTSVLLNRYRGVAEPTFCPDCGRLVVARNPVPVEGSPPPTAAEYRKGSAGLVEP